MPSNAYRRFAGSAAPAAAVTTFVYSVAFVAVTPVSPHAGRTLAALCLGLGALFSTAVLVGIYDAVRETDPARALWGLLLGIIGAAGALVHGGYDLAVALGPASGAGVPAGALSPVDPRGLLTFGASGVGLAVLAGLMAQGSSGGRAGAFPGPLAGLGYLLAVLEIILYLGRLLIVTPSNPLIVVPALLAGFIVGPAWYLWLGVVFRRAPA